jgi:hypothetical protein
MMVCLRCHAAKWLLFGVLCLGFFRSLGVDPAAAQRVRSYEEIERILTIEKISISEGNIQGEVRNKSNLALRDVQLFIRYTWLWDDERNPGSTDPGTSAYLTLEREIPPQGRTPFTYKPSPPLPKMSGGRFDTSVTIAGFTEVIPPPQ